VGCVYRATNKVNGKIYIGMTTQSLEKRKIQHFSNANKPKYIFHRAIKKYGKESFDWEILHESDSQKELFRLESQEIENQESGKSENGYNIMLGDNSKSEGTLKHVAINRVQEMVDSYTLLVPKARESHNAIVDGTIKMKKGLECYTLLWLQLFIECSKQLRKYKNLIEYIKTTNAPRYKHIFGKIEAVYE